MLNGWRHTIQYIQTAKKWRSSFRSSSAKRHLLRVYLKQLKKLSGNLKFRFKMIKRSMKSRRKLISNNKSELITKCCSKQCYLTFLKTKACYTHSTVIYMLHVKMIFNMIHYRSFFCQNKAWPESGSSS